MPVFDMRGKPLPPGHPLSRGPLIVFGAKRPDSSKTPSPESSPPEGERGKPIPEKPKA